MLSNDVQSVSRSSWSVIDAALDNRAVIAAQNGDVEINAGCREIRKLGWDARGRHAEADRDLAVALAPEQWALIWATLVTAHETEKLLGRDPEPLECALAEVRNLLN